ARYLSGVMPALQGPREDQVQEDGGHDGEEDASGEGYVDGRGPAMERQVAGKMKAPEEHQRPADDDEEHAEDKKQSPDICHCLLTVGGFAEIRVAAARSRCGGRRARWPRGRERSWQGSRSGSGRARAHPRSSPALRTTRWRACPGRRALL